MSQSSKSNEWDVWQNDLLTVVEVATYFRISRVTVWRWCQQGILPAIRVGRGWRIHRNDLLHLSKPRYSNSELMEPGLSVVNEKEL